MLGHYNIPSVDHLREGIDYRVVNWNFADAAPAPVPSHIPGTPCPPGEKMVFGVCRKVKQDGDWDSGNDTKQETELKGAAQKAGSEVKSNKAFESGGKKFGWAIKNGKPVIVEWGSVAGVKKVGAKQAPQPAKAASPGPASAPAKTGGGGGSVSPAAPKAAAAPPARSSGVGSPLSAADRSAYAAGGGNAAAQRGTGSSTEQVIAQGRKNLERMNQAKGRS